MALAGPIKHWGEKECNSVKQQALAAQDWPDGGPQMPPIKVRSPVGRYGTLGGRGGGGGISLRFFEPSKEVQTNKAFPKMSASCPERESLLLLLMDTCDDHDDDDDCARQVTVAMGKSDVAIKIADEGGGASRSDIELLWTYFYTTANSSLAGNTTLPPVSLHLDGGPPACAPPSALPLGRDRRLAHVRFDPIGSLPRADCLRVVSRTRGMTIGRSPCCPSKVTVQWNMPCFALTCAVHVPSVGQALTAAGRMRHGHGGFTPHPNEKGADAADGGGYRRPRLMPLHLVLWLLQAIAPGGRVFEYSNTGLTSVISAW